MPRNKNETPEETKKHIQTQALQETEILARKFIFLEKENCKFF